MWNSIGKNFQADWAKWDPTRAPISNLGTESGADLIAPNFNLDEDWLRSVGYTGPVQTNLGTNTDSGAQGNQTAPELMQWLKDNGYSLQLAGTESGTPGLSNKNLGRLVDANGNQIGEGQQWAVGNDDAFGIAAALGLGGAAASVAAAGGAGAGLGAGGAADAGGLAGTGLPEYAAYTGPGSAGSLTAGPGGLGTEAVGGSTLGGAQAIENAAMAGASSAPYEAGGWGMGAGTGGGIGGATGGSGGWLGSINDTLGTSLSGGDLLRGGAAIGNGLLSTYTAGRALDQQQRATDQANALWAPYREAGTAALGNMTSLLKNPGTVLNDPGVAFQQQQGQRNLDNSAAVRGGLYSGQQIRAGARYNQDYASTALDKALQRYGNVAQLGATGTQATTNNLVSLGDAGAAASLYQGNAWRGALNDLAGQSTYRNPLLPTRWGP